MSAPSRYRRRLEEPRPLFFGLSGRLEAPLPRAGEGRDAAETDERREDSRPEHRERARADDEAGQERPSDPNAGDAEAKPDERPKSARDEGRPPDARGIPGAGLERARRLLGEALLEGGRRHEGDERRRQERD
jgi:hypothetical protein